MTIAKNIKRLREIHGLSQRDLALIANVSDKAVSTWENGTKLPRMGAIQRIADHFGIFKSDIIEEDLTTKPLLPPLDGDTARIVGKFLADRNTAQRELKLEIIKDIVQINFTDEQLKTFSAFLKSFK